MVASNNETLDRLIVEELRTTTERRIEHVLKEAEENFKRNIAAHIRYHRFLEQEATKRQDNIQANYHAIRSEVYQQILDNVSPSSSYNHR